MPHFVIDCSFSVLRGEIEDSINKKVHQVACSTKLFDEKDLKVRVNSYNHYLVGNKKEDFIHVFAHVMEGRSDAQKYELSRRIVRKLTAMFSAISNIAMNISEFEKATYCNRHML